MHLLAKNLTYMYVFSRCCIHSWSKKLLKNQHKQRNRLFINYCNKLCEYDIDWQSEAKREKLNSLYSVLYSILIYICAILYTYLYVNYSLHQNGRHCFCNMFKCSTVCKFWVGLFLVSRNLLSAQCCVSNCAHHEIIILK